MNLKHKTKTCISLIICFTVAAGIVAWVLYDHFSSPITRLPREDESLEDYVMSIEWKHWRKDGERSHVITGPYTFEYLTVVASKGPDAEDREIFESINVMVTDNKNRTWTFIRFRTDTSLPKEERIVSIKTYNMET